jgi:hypothetical protein
MVDLAVPLLTNDATTKAMDIVGASPPNRQDMTDDQCLRWAIRESCITLISLLKPLHHLDLLAHKPVETGMFINAICQLHVAAAKANVQLLALQCAKDAGR